MSAGDLADLLKIVGNGKFGGGRSGSLLSGAALNCPPLTAPRPFLPPDPAI
jgi:hypothetical protein